MPSVEKRVYVVVEAVKPQRKWTNGMRTLACVTQHAPARPPLSKHHFSFGLGHVMIADIFLVHALAIGSPVHPKCSLLPYFPPNMYRCSIYPHATQHVSQLIAQTSAPMLHNPYHVPRVLFHGVEPQMVCKFEDNY